MVGAASNVKLKNVEIQYRVTGVSDWSGPRGYYGTTYLGQTVYNFINMVPGQSYEFRVRAIYYGIELIHRCSEGYYDYYGGADVAGEWSDIKSITVPAAPAFGGVPRNPAAIVQPAVSLRPQDTVAV